MGALATAWVRSRRRLIRAEFTNSAYQRVIPFLLVWVANCALLHVHSRRLFILDIAGWLYSRRCPVPKAISSPRRPCAIEEYDSGFGCAVCLSLSLRLLQLLFIVFK
jgi:hypothetical protein